MKSIIARCVVVVGAAAFLPYGCETPTDTMADGTGGQTSASGGSGGSSSSGGTSGTGGSVSTGGSSISGGTGGTGGAGAGGTTASGGSSGTGGTSATGGRTGSGGTTAAGGAIGSGGDSGIGGATSTGGRAMGGATGPGGGSGTGGATGTGGRTAGGSTGAGGTTVGGSTGGGSGTGGSTGTGGGSGTGGSTGPCTPVWENPPSNVSAWIDASWNEQLGANVRSRKAWLLDNVMMGKGQINLCVRWGATSAPSADVKKNMASSVERWFNDWFSKLDGYGCFPYPRVGVKVTGWAVRPGNESWVSDLDSSIKVYTETDPSSDPKNEPKCPDACSFFTNWNHTFPNCPGGEAFHHDYWIWLDDNLPGGGAAAVGGDWGVRMPASSFISAMGKSAMVLEHEIGHGFGFQDYYDWPANGPRPEGGSLMIVGSTSSQTPTIGDQWLLRRTWREMTSLRGWP